MLGEGHIEEGAVTPYDSSEKMEKYGLAQARNLGGNRAEKSMVASSALSVLDN